MVRLCRRTRSPSTTRRPCPVVHPCCPCDKATPRAHPKARVLIPFCRLLTAIQSLCDSVPGHPVPTRLILTQTRHRLVAAIRAVRARPVRRRRRDLVFLPLLARQLPADQRQAAPFDRIGQKTIVMDAHEALGQDMQQKAPKQLFGRQSQGSVARGAVVVVCAAKGPRSALACLATRSLGTLPPGRVRWLSNLSVCAFGLWGPWGGACSDLTLGIADPPGFASCSPGKSGLSQLVLQRSSNQRSACMAWPIPCPTAMPRSSRIWRQGSRFGSKYSNSSISSRLARL